MKSILTLFFVLKNVDSNQEDILILQENSAEPTTSYIIYAPMDVATINGLFGGVGDPGTVKLLSSSFSILPSGPPGFEGGINDITFIDGTLLSMAFQILVDSDPYEKLSASSISSVSNLIKSTHKSKHKKIKFSLGVLF